MKEEGKKGEQRGERGGGRTGKEGDCRDGTPTLNVSRLELVDPVVADPVAQDDDKRNNL